MFFKEIMAIQYKITLCVRIIVQKLFISPRTVDTHRNNLIQKLHVHGVADLIRFAVMNKVI